MNSTVSSILEIYVSLGGQLTDTFDDIAGGIPVGQYNLIPDALEALGKIAGSTVELPAVSGSDNGKVLKVIEGEWAKGTDESLPAVTADDNGKALIVSDGAWGAGNIPAELPAVTSSDNGKQLTVLGGKWSKTQLIAKREATVTLSEAAASMDFSLGSAGNSIPVGIEISDMATQYKLANINFKTEPVFYNNPYPNNYVRLTAPEGSTFQAGTYKIFIIIIDAGNLSVR